MAATLATLAIADRPIKRCEVTISIKMRIVMYRKSNESVRIKVRSTSRGYT
jgi:hypothetical protein